MDGGEPPSGGWELGLSHLSSPHTKLLQNVIKCKKGRIHTTVWKALFYRARLLRRLPRALAIPPVGVGAAVDPAVDEEVGAPTEALPTDLAAVRLLPRVHSPVGLQL